MMISCIGVHHSVSELFPPDVLQRALDGLSAEIRVVQAPNTLDICDAVVTFAYDEAFLNADLVWIHSIQSGVDRFPLNELEERGIALTSSAGIHGDSVGETVAGCMLQFARRLHVYRTNEHRQEWRYPPWDAAFTLAGESCCVVGLGTLGQGIAMRADVLGMHVSGVRRSPIPVDHVERVYTTEELDEALAEALFVVLAIPLTERTRHLIGADELAVMRDDAYLINVARGSVVDEAALVQTLQEEKLAGAALDVFEEEPLPAESPLWELENVIVTPHAAAATREYSARIAALVRENTRRLAAGESLVNPVL
ncbi:MAG TPA: D-2-hydroxyacid dehydrogenase [Halococcus sp.]|nr:D-2-hydroxyacid dehydrogenase [Halococcus sp.]